MKRTFIGLLAGNDKDYQMEVVIELHGERSEKIKRKVMELLIKEGKLVKEVPLTFEELGAFWSGKEEEKD